jgi:hypothetical protein
MPRRSLAGSGDFAGSQTSPARGDSRQGFGSASGGGPSSSTVVSTGGAGPERSSKRRSQMHAPPAGDAQQPYTHHRRDKTKSTQLYLQTPSSSSRRDQSLQHAAKGSGATSSVRPILSERSNSAPLDLAQKSSSSIPAAQGDGLAQYPELAAEPGDDEAIVEDPFFQQYVQASGEKVLAGAVAGAENTTPGNSPSEDEGDSDVDGPLSPTSTAMRFRPDSVAEPISSPLTPTVVSALVNPRVLF